MLAGSLYLKLVDVGHCRRAEVDRTGAAMRQRRDIEQGKDLSPGQNWAAYRRDLHRELVDSLMPSRLREGIAPAEDASPS